MIRIRTQYLLLLSIFFLQNGDTFCLKSGIYTNDFTEEEVVEITKQYIEAAEAFLALTNLSESNSNSDTIAGAFKHALKQYLYNYQVMIFHIMQERSSNATYICDLKLLIEQVCYIFSYKHHFFIIFFVCNL